MKPIIYNVFVRMYVCDYPVFYVTAFTYTHICSHMCHMYHCVVDSEICVAHVQYTLIRLGTYA